MPATAWTAAPSPRLKPFVQCYRGVSTGDQQSFAQTVLPSGMPYLYFLFQGSLCFVDKIGTEKDLPAFGFSGSGVDFGLFQGEAIDLVAVQLHPGMTEAVLHIPPSEFQNPYTDLRDLWSVDEIDRLRQLEGYTPSVRIAFIEGWLWRRLDHHRLPDAALRQAVHLLQRTSGQIALPSLETHVNLSYRQLQRKFHHSIGLSPKYFARALRFSQTIGRLLAHPGPVVIPDGYYDQSHFIRESLTFTGHPPTRLLQLIRTLEPHDDAIIQYNVASLP
ncbi:MAG: helix-turn-helix domain-containing protein [bacterium]|nr:helix-turn-helix domain-containing protein [bacterium]